MKKKNKVINMCPKYVCLGKSLMVNFLSSSEKKKLHITYIYHRHHHITTHFFQSFSPQFSNTNIFYRIGSNQHNLRANNVASIGVCVVLGGVWFGHGIDLNMRLCIRVCCLLVSLYTTYPKLGIIKVLFYYK